MLIFGFVVLFIGFLAFSVIKENSNVEVSDYATRKLMRSFINGKPEGFFKQFDEVLNEKLPYYRKLSIKGKAKFINRVYEFSESTNFYTKGDLELSDEMWITISGIAIQLTFGLNSYMIPSLESIIIYPDKFYYSPKNEYHTGSASINGEVRVSWKHFQKGMAIEDDKLNLGLHELAHALELNFLMEEDYDYYFTKYHEALISEEEDVLEDIENNNNHFLRQYAGTNLREFFAVSVENFFEAPEELRKNLPELYHSLCLLLNQDPTNRFNNDYKLSFKKPIAKEETIWGTPFSSASIADNKPVENIPKEETLVDTDTQTAPFDHTIGKNNFEKQYEKKQEVYKYIESQYKKREQYLRNVEPRKPFLKDYFIYLLLEIPIILIAIFSEEYYLIGLAVLSFVVVAFIKSKKDF